MLVLDDDNGISRTSVEGRGKLAMYRRACRSARAISC